MGWRSRRMRKAALVFRREGGAAPPDHEVLSVAGDGTFTMWRTVARSTQPPSPVGRFAGTLPPERWAALTAALRACERADAVTLALPPDAAREKVVLGKRISTWADDVVPPSPFAPLATEARRLLGELTAAPLAALAVSDWDGPQLCQLGPEPLDLDLSRAMVRVVRWDGARAAEDWRASLDGPRSISATRGWTFRLPFSHPFGLSSELSVEISDLLAFDGEFWRACALSSR